MQVTAEREAFVGFYWTFSVPLVGYRQLSRDVDAAAAESLTIRYQRERIRRYATEARGRIVGEIAFMEVSPDRGTEFIEEPVRQAQALAREHGATILAVAFHHLSGWRQHTHLWSALSRGDAPLETVSPDPVPLDGRLFDPEAHFSAWRELSRELATTRRRTVEEALGAALDRVGEGYGRWTEIADLLNAEGVPTITGQPWTAENVRKTSGRRWSRE